jgi:hypothetical protein
MVEADTDYSVGSKGPRLLPEDLQGLVIDGSQFLLIRLRSTTKYIRQTGKDVTE